MDRSELRHLVLAALLVGLMAAGAYVAIPVGPVPIVLQNLFVLIAGLLLGPGWGLAAVLTYLALGALGLPVFAGGAGGLARFAGPTGGYLLGYLPAVILAGLIARRRSSVVALVAGAAVATLVVYAVGVPWLALVMRTSLQRALAIGLFPFVPADAVKVVVASVVARWARPLVQESSQ